jgi:hypothetical protein
MTAIEEALAELSGSLEGKRVPYMLVGGLANAIWGEPRATLDIDVTVWVDEQQVPDLVAFLRASFRVLVPDPVTFIRDTRVLPLESTTGVRVDVIFGLLPLERQAIERARRLAIAGTEVRVCTPEDLILMKIVSDRGRDLDDAKAITRRRAESLDFAYLEPRIRALSVELEKPEIIQRWEDWKGEAQGPRTEDSQ